MATTTPSSAQSSGSAANKKRIPCPVCGTDQSPGQSSGQSSNRPFNQPLRRQGGLRACTVCAFDFSSLSEGKGAEATQKCSRCAAMLPEMADACQVCGLATALRLPRPHTAELLIKTPSPEGASPNSHSKLNAPSKSAFRVEFSGRSVRENQESSVSRRIVVVQSDGSVGQTVTMGSESLVIGSDEECGLCFVEDPFINPRHAMLIRNEKGAILVDLASKNGVYRRIVQSVILNSCDQFLVGQQLFRYDSIADLVEQNLGGGAKVRSFGSVCENGWGRLSRMIGDIWLEAFLLTAEEFQIGRDHGDIRFGSDVFMSRRHVCLRRTSDGPSLNDLGSANGTYLRINESIQIQVGDFFRVGDEVLQLRND